MPLYLRGIPLLGQDASITLAYPEADLVPPPVIADPSIGAGDTSLLFPSENTSIQPLIDSGFSPSDAATISDLASKGWLNQTDWNDLFAGNVTASELASINYGASAAQEAAAAANAAKAATNVATAVVKAATPSGMQKVSLPAGSSPRVNVSPAVNPAAPSTSSFGSWFTGSTPIGGTEVPNIAIIAGVAALGGLLFMGGRGYGRRR